MTRQVFCLFADDVRDETGNKSSLMGIYGQSINFPSFPARLDRLWVCAYLTTPYAKRFETVSLTIKLNDAVLVKHNIPDEFVRRFWQESEAACAAGVCTPDDSVTLGMNAQIAMIEAESPCTIAAIVTVDGEDFIAGKIRMLEQATANRIGG